MSLCLGALFISLFHEQVVAGSVFYVDIQKNNVKKYTQNGSLIIIGGNFRGIEFIMANIRETVQYDYVIEPVS